MNVKNTKIDIIFNDTTGGISGIRSVADNHQFIRGKSDKSLLWRLIFRNSSMKEIVLDNASVNSPVFEDNCIRWNSISLPDGRFDVVVTYNSSDDDLSLKISIDNHSKSYGLWDLAFPVISPIVEAEKADIAISRGNWGQLYTNANETIAGEYPSYLMPMQFMLINEGVSGLYLAAHDERALYKKFLCIPGQEFSVNTFPENMGIPSSKWDMPFPFVIKAYSGDWMTGCKIYRNWAAKNAPWTSKGPIADRVDFPEQMRKTAAWIIGRNGGDEAKDTALKYSESIGVPVGVHWYDWHQIPFDRYYPAYFPTKNGMAEGVKAMKDAGIISMPYINCRIWDTQEANYNSAVPFTVKDENGDTILEDYGSGTKFGVMCPTQKFWQDKIMELVKRLVEELGVNAIYLDQIASAAPRYCFDKSHGHPIGSGSWWVDGYQEMLTRIKEYCISQGRMVGLTSENNAEPYMGCIDSFLIWTPREQNEIPMITAVYSGYALYFASNRAFTYAFYGKNNQGYGDESFCLLQARDFVWGTQLGWEDKNILEPEHKCKLEFQSKLAKIRANITDYLSDGELIKVLKNQNSIQNITGTWDTWNGDAPVSINPVHGALWQGCDGTFAAVFANADVKSHEFSFTIQKDAFGNISNNIRLFSDDKEIKLDENDNFTDTVEIDARDGKVKIYKLIE